MAVAEIKVYGLDEILDKLRAIGPDLQETLQPVAESVLSMLYADVRNYPPERPGQRYVRTHNLQDSWRMEQGGNDEVLGWVISTGPDYNRYVMDENEQAGIHAGRWNTVQGIARDREEQARQLVEAFLNQLLGSA